MSKYPLIIFGAGASHDSIDDHNRFDTRKIPDLVKWQPPVTDNIFNRTRFQEVLDKHDETRYIAAEASYKITKDNSFEDLLTDILVNKAPARPIWYQRLMSLKFYLQDLFYKITREYFDESNNYYRLLSVFEDNQINEACIVNFNYDLLLEWNIPAIKNARKVDSYISGPIKIIKIHGACNWFRFVGGGIKSDDDFKNGRDYSIGKGENILKSEAPNQKIEKISSEPIIKNLDEDWEFYEDFRGGFFDDEVRYFAPDLALPTHHKRDFVCPERHIETLKNEFQKIDRVIIIGWKAEDKYLLDILKEYVGNRPIIIISRNNPGKIKEKIIQNCNLSPSRVVVLKESFTDFIKNGHCNEILSAENVDVLIQSNLFRGDSN